MELFIIILIVGAAVLYLLKRAKSSLSVQGTTCAGGCASCDVSKNCEESSDVKR